MKIKQRNRRERLEFDLLKVQGFISWVCGSCRLPRQHKPTCKFKRLPFSALVATTDNLEMVSRLFSTISMNSTTFASPLQSVSSTKISTSSSNFESLGIQGSALSVLANSGFYKIVKNGFKVIYFFNYVILRKN